jgi:hypothetical protein
MKYKEAKYKGATLKIEDKNNLLIAIVEANGRHVGEYTFVKVDKKTIKLVQSLEIEKDFYPYEVMSTEIKDILKTRKITKILL